VAEAVRAGNSPDLRVFIRDKLDGKLSTQFFDRIGSGFAQWYAQDNRSNPYVYLRDYRDFALAGLKDHTWNGIEEEEAAYLLLPYTEESYEAISAILDKRLKEFLETEFEDARKLTGENIDRFFKYIGEKKLHPNTFNRYVKAVDHFYQYLLTRYQVKRIPFHKEYYLKTEIYRHHDRSVDEVISKEILKNLQYFPEDIRLMYLHLWAVGMRISEVCTIKAKEYYRQDDDYWMQIYQVKMRNYKRIPIPEVLYRLMQVYIKKKRRKPEDYVFQNKKGGAFCSSTFRERMKKLCETYQIGDGTYIFQAHGYRHTLATVFYDEGVPLQSVRDYLGHAYEEMTQQYIDYMPRWIDEASKAYFKETDNSLSVGLKERWKHGGSHRHKDTTMLPESN